jgi:hypothetical protein
VTYNPFTVITHAIQIGAMACDGCDSVSKLPRDVKENRHIYLALLFSNPLLIDMNQ